MLTSEERNIRRIGSLQSSFSNVGVLGVVFVVGGGLLRLDGRDEGDGGGSSRHHRFCVSWMAAPTMLSPSSFPQTSSKMSEARKGDKIKARTFENNSILWDPNVAKGPCFLSGFKKHPARRTRVVSQDTDSLVVKSLDWVASKFALVLLW
jgi:hypothetical protein